MQQMHKISSYVFWKVWNALKGTSFMNNKDFIKALFIHQLMH